MCLPQPVRMEYQNRKLREVQKIKLYFRAATPAPRCTGHMEIVTHPVAAVIEKFMVQEGASVHVYSCMKTLISWALREVKKKKRVG